MKISRRTSLNIFLLTVAFCLLQLAISNNSFATPITVSRLPAYRTVKVKVRMKVREDFPRTLTSISHGVTITSSNGGSKNLTPLTSEIYYTPLTPSVEPLPSNDTTTDPSPTFSGAADPNTTIEVYDGESLLGRVTADANGKWSFTPSQDLSYGRHSFKIRAINGRSLTSEFSNLYEVVIDCPAGRFGSSCERSCPETDGKVCGGHGECSDGLEGTGSCSCELGFFDPSCTLSSNTCAVDLADGVYTKDDWSGIAPYLVTNNKVNGDSFDWSGGKWRAATSRRTARFVVAPDAWFGIRSVRSCLGYQKGKQVLHLLVDGKRPLGSYSDTRNGREYRLGLGPLSEAKAPVEGQYRVVWKIMFSRGGPIHYLVAGITFNTDTQYNTPIFQSIGMYRETSKLEFTPREFQIQEFDPNSDRFISDLSDVLVPIQNTNLSTDPGKTSAVEIGVDLLRFQEILGFSLTSATKIQVNTYQNISDASLRKIDGTDVGTLSNLSTQIGQGLPTIKVVQRKSSRATLACLSPEGVTASKYVYRLRRLDSKTTSTFTRERSKITTRVVQGAQYEATCSYVTKEGERSQQSTEKAFVALIRQ